MRLINKGRSLVLSLMVAATTLAIVSTSSVLAGEVLEDYKAAWDLARSSKKLMLVLFVSDAPEIQPTLKFFEQATLADKTVQNFLKSYVTVKLPVDYVSENQPFIKHPSFKELNGLPGIVILNPVEKTKFQGVLSIYSFYNLPKGKAVSPQKTDVFRNILMLPMAPRAQRDSHMVRLLDPMVPNPNRVVLSDSEFEVIRLTNVNRTQRGLSILAVAPDLMTGCRGHSQWMVSAGLQHTSQPVVENIAKGQNSASEVVGDWMSSPGHRANMLGGYSQIGVGVCNDSWTQRFR